MPSIPSPTAPDAATERRCYSTATIRGYLDVRGENESGTISGPAAKANEKDIVVSVFEL
jgi:hypothetical protein